MPDFGSPFSGLARDRKLSEAELVRAIRFMVAAEYEAVQGDIMIHLLAATPYFNLRIYQEASGKLD